MTLAQGVAIFVAVCAFLAGGSAAAQMADIVGTPAAHIIGSVCGLFAGVGGIVLTALNSESAQIKAVEQRPGVTKIVTNDAAVGKLAEFATDPDHPKIGQTPPQ